MLRFGKSLVVTASLAAATLAASPCWANDPAAAIDRHLQAGEFAPALRLARQAPADERDALLARVSHAQAQAGMRRAAISTAGDIGSDLYRAQTVNQAASEPVGRRGGLAEPDFESLIELITTTVATNSWDDAGGPGTIREFEGGVRVDAAGKVVSLLKLDDSGSVARVRRSSIPASGNADVRQASALRKVSLNRLERLVQLKLAAGDPLDEEMEVLAGLQRVQYVLVYPDTGDIVLAGPAGDWKADGENRIVSTDNGRPVLQLDDLIVVLRHMIERRNEPFGVSIEPLRENLARTKTFLESWSGKPVRTAQRAQWLKDLRENLGLQSVEYYGIDPRTRVGRVLFEADYRMKLVGIGLEDGTVNVPSYLSQIKVAKGQPAPPMGMLRWWFTLNYDALLTTPDRNGFELRGQGVKVLSENELLTELGERVHTGQSDPLTADFAARFTKHFGELANKYPVYADMQNIFDLALVAALMQAEDLPGQVGWRMTSFGSPEAYPVALGHAPQMVDSVLNHRIVNGSDILAAVSGGVRVDPAEMVQTQSIDTDKGGKLDSRRHAAAPERLPVGVWWWD